MCDVGDKVHKGLVFWSLFPVLQVKGSRFFEWTAKWTNFSPFWGFLRIIYDMWHFLKGKDLEGAVEPEVPDGDADPAADPDVQQDLEADERRAPRGSMRQVHADLVQELREKQKSRHTLAVVRDILHDDRVKTYALMRLGYTQDFRVYWLTSRARRLASHYMSKDCRFSTRAFVGLPGTDRRAAKRGSCQVGNAEC